MKALREFWHETADLIMPISALEVFFIWLIVLSYCHSSLSYLLSILGFFLAEIALATCMLLLPLDTE
jgi:hypothetical protein